MFAGIMAGVLWALDTVILGVVFAMSPFMSTEEAMMLAPLVSTFLHDACSSLWMLIYTGIRRQYRQVGQALRRRSGRFIILGALLGGPIGMSGYVAAIKFMGPAYTAIVSALFPALGAFFSYIFLREKMTRVQILGLVISIGGVIALGYQPAAGQFENLPLGMICALVCCAGWAAEAVICAYGLKDPDITDDQALQIRQLTSALTYAGPILIALKAWPMTLSVIPTQAFGIIAIAALFGTASYLFYYRAIATIGASRSMALNITYSAWAIAFAWLLFRQTPSIFGLVCAVVIVLGSLIAANGLPSVRRAHS